MSRFSGAVLADHHAAAEIFREVGSGRAFLRDRRGARRPVLAGL
jgi:hypothetical protein